MKSLNRLALVPLLLFSLIFPIKIFSDKRTIFNQTFPVEMVYDFGEKKEEQINIHASLDEEKNTLYFETYTQDYNRKNWIGSDKIHLPIPKRHTNINYTYSRIFLLSPKRVKIKELEQKAYIIPKYKWISELEPYEKRQTTQLIVETGERFIDKLFSGFSFLNKAYDKFLEDAKEREKEYYEKIFEKIEEDYNIIRINPYIPQNPIGYTETAREYIIEFDIGKTKDEIPMFVWFKIALGDPTQSSYGSFPNKYGELEHILIEFSLNKSKQQQELNDYFFHDEELNFINTSLKNVEWANSNPATASVINLNKEERKYFEDNKIIQVGFAEYIIQKIEDDSKEKNLSFRVLEFESKKSLEDFLNKNEDVLSYPLFLKENVMSFIETPTIKEIINPIEDVSEEQSSAYKDLILDYAERTSMEIILSSNETENKELLNTIKGYK